MIRSIPPKTSTGASRVKKGGKRNFGKLGGAIKIRIGQVKKAAPKKVKPIRSWTFASKPKFTRYSPTVKYAMIERMKEPAVRMLEDISEILTVAFLPGVKEKDIHIELHGDILEISAQAKDQFGLQKYAKEILLPFMADPGAIKSSFENNVLEIKLQRKGEEKGNEEKNFGSR